MKWRKISEADIEAALTCPDRVELTEKLRLNAYKAIKNKLLKVTFFKQDDQLKVVTAVWKGE